MAEVFFFIAGIGAVCGAVGVVMVRNPFYSVLALVFHLLSLAALFLLLQAQFVAAAQVVVYAGAVMVLYVFVVAYVGGSDPGTLRPPVGRGQQVIAVLFGLALFVELAIAVLGSGLKAISTDGPTVDATFGSPERIGELLLTKFLLPFEVASFLLLIAAVGAVVLARRRGGIGADEADRVAVMDFRLPPDIGTMAEAVGGRSTREPAGARLGRRRAEPGGRVRSGGRLVSLDWYLVVSALIFSIGAAGVLTRRNPLVILLCLELMLNAANIALIAFARMWNNGDGQIFAIIVMVVAACEVCIGLGLVVALYRRRLPIDVDEIRELHG